MLWTTRRTGATFTAAVIATPETWVKVICGRCDGLGDIPNREDILDPCPECQGAGGFEIRLGELVKAVETGEPVTRPEDPVPAR